VQCCRKKIAIKTVVIENGKSGRTKRRALDEESHDEKKLEFRRSRDPSRANPDEA
jgi:hypothetical protein